MFYKYENVRNTINENKWGLVVVVYHVTIVVGMGIGLLRSGLLVIGCVYALQGVPLYETMQPRLLRENYIIITSPWPLVVAGLHIVSFNVRTPLS